MFHEVHGPQFVSGFWKNWTPTFIVCLIFQNQTSWSEHLTSLECAYNTIPTTVTDMSPFHFTYRYQLPWFQENDGDKGLPLTLFHGKMLPPDLGGRPSEAWYRWRWQLTGIDTAWRVTLGSGCQPMIFLFMCTLKNWLRSLKVHPNFHIIRLNLSKNSPLVPPSKLAPPSRMIEAGQANTVKKLLAAANRGCSGQYLVEREVLNGRSWITYKERLWISASCIFNSSFRLSYVSKSSSWTKESVKWWGTVYVLFYLLLISQFLILCNISSFFFLEI